MDADITLRVDGEARRLTVDTRTTLLDALRELRDRGCAILLVAEKAHEVMTLADTMVFMELGRVVWAGPRDAADADLLAATYLGIN